MLLGSDVKIPQLFKISNTIASSVKGIGANGMNGSDTCPCVVGGLPS
jgi:hypothetical protein